MKNILNETTEYRLKIEFLQKGWNLLNVRKGRRNFRKKFYEKIMEFAGVLKRQTPTTVKGWFLNPERNMPKDNIDNFLLILEENLVVTLYEQCAEEKELYKKEVHKLKVSYENKIEPIEKLLEENPWKH